MPSARSRFASAGADAGQRLDASRRAAPAAPTRAAAASSCWTTPVKPVCIRVIVATGTEHRTRTGRHHSATRPRTRRSRPCPGPACVPTTAPSVVAISICACGRSCSTSSRSASQPLGRGGVRDPDLQPRRVGRRRLEQLAELGERLGVAAHALQRHDLAVADRQDRLHVQQVAGERGSAADAAALREVLERVDREEQLVPCAGSARRTRRSPRRSCRARAAAGRRSRAARSPPRRCACRSRARGHRRASRPPSRRSRTCPRASRRSAARGSARSSPSSS